MMIQENAGVKTLALLRIVVFGCWLIIAVLFSPWSYSMLPVSIFESWGAYRVINLFPVELLEILLSEWFLLSLKGFLIVGCLFCMLGVRPFKPIAIFTVFLIVVYDFVVRGFNGFINHAQIGIFFSAIFIAFSPAVDSLSIHKKRLEKPGKDYSFPTVLTALTLTLAYSFIGIRRFMVGGLEILTNDALLTYLVRNTLNYSPYGFELSLTLIEYGWVILLLKVGFFVVTIAEVLSPFILFNNYLRYAWLIIMVPFHFMTLFTMNIFFWENLLLISVLFIDWENINYASLCPIIKVCRIK